MTGRSRVIPTATATPNVVVWLTHLLNQPLSPVVIICSTRDAFLDELQAVYEQETSEPFFRPPSLFLLNRLRKVHLVFTPTWSVLRAVLAAGSWTATTPDALAIWGLLQGHRGTNQYSAQGLGRSLGLAVDATRSIPLMFGEPCCADSTSSQGKAVASQRTAAPYADDEDTARPWNEQVPLLSGSIPLVASGAMQSRTMPVGRIFARWCRFAPT